jgi:hypothetical protein
MIRAGSDRQNHGAAFLGALLATALVAGALVFGRAKADDPLVPPVCDCGAYLLHTDACGGAKVDIDYRNSTSGHCPPAGGACEFVFSCNNVGQIIVTPPLPGGSLNSLDHPLPCIPHSHLYVATASVDECGLQDGDIVHVYSAANCLAENHKCNITIAVGCYVCTSG